MTPRPSSPAHPDDVFSIGWSRKAAALAMHLACMALFGATVVWPVVAPLAQGELGRDVAAWTSGLANELLASPSADQQHHHAGSGCRPVCLRVDAR